MTERTGDTKRRGDATMTLTERRQSDRNEMVQETKAIVIILRAKQITI